MNDSQSTDYSVDSEILPVYGVGNFGLTAKGYPKIIPKLSQTNT